MWECIKVGKTRVVSVEYGGQNVLNIEGHSAQNISFIINNDSTISLGIRSGPPYTTEKGTKVERSSTKCPKKWVVWRQ